MGFLWVQIPSPLENVSTLLIFFNPLIFFKTLLRLKRQNHFNILKPPPDRAWSVSRLNPTTNIGCRRRSGLLYYNSLNHLEWENGQPVECVLRRWSRSSDRCSLGGCGASALVAELCAGWARRISRTTWGGTSVRSAAVTALNHTRRYAPLSLDNKAPADSGL